ncbi:MAG: TRAP transporter small permease subunit [SAR324 cluster bacterium]|nr:TRAP transporter small permease subunit [SAR324 cluster bacterium]
MILIDSLIKVLEKVNRIIALIGNSVAWLLVALMVASILLQVFFRYVLNNALPWPEEAARAFMIWMMAMVASSAYRSGSFVAIEMLQDVLPELMAKVLRFLLLLMAAAVLYHLFVMGIEFFQRGFRTRAASFALKRAWIYLAMPVCFGSMLLVNLELLLSAFRQIFSDQTLSDPT